MEAGPICQKRKRVYPTHFPPFAGHLSDQSQSVRLVPAGRDQNAWEPSRTLRRNMVHGLNLCSRMGMFAPFRPDQDGPRRSGMAFDRSLVSPYAPSGSDAGGRSVLQSVLQKMFAAAVVSILLASSAVSPASAQEGFRSPSGNIHCQYFAIDGDATIRCDLRQISNRPAPRPRDCDLEWGKAFEISGRAGRGSLICHGDTVQDPRLPVLAYGQSWQRAGLTCLSEETGVSCRNARGHGFTLSRAAQRVF